MSKKADKYAAGAASLADDLAEFQQAVPQTYPDPDVEPPAPKQVKPPRTKPTAPRKPRAEQRRETRVEPSGERLKPGPTPPAYRAQVPMVAFGSKMTAETKETLRQLKGMTGKTEIDLLEEALQALFTTYRKKGLSI